MACGILALNCESYLTLKLALDSKSSGLGLEGSGLSLEGPGLGLVLGLDYNTVNKSANSARKYKFRMWNRYRQSKSYNDLVEYKIGQNKAVKALWCSG